MIRSNGRVRSIANCSDRSVIIVHWVWRFVGLIAFVCPWRNFEIVRLLIWVMLIEVIRSVVAMAGR